jgi:hypothetical protein
MPLRRCGQPVAKADMVYFLMQEGAHEPVLCRILVDELADYARLPNRQRNAREIEQVFDKFRAELEAAAQAQYDRGARLITLRSRDLN